MRGFLLNDKERYELTDILEREMNVLGSILILEKMSHLKRRGIEEKTFLIEALLRRLQ